ncbi:hypothetical protein [Streptomyces sp. RFCAC02]|uniref:hypothetical protein n=1 Tax=Streptomyces sp. RFCAC02 TaxID=2499143 RepID=UPI00101F9F89|nr:hypothetical protein [Streptomyces sp. RFCAC02]
MPDVRPCHGIELLGDILAGAFRATDPVIARKFPPGMPERERRLRGFLDTWVAFMLGRGGSSIVTGDHNGAMVREPARRGTPSGSSTTSPRRRGRRPGAAAD